MGCLHPSCICAGEHQEWACVQQSRTHLCEGKHPAEHPDLMSCLEITPVCWDLLQFGVIPVLWSSSGDCVRVLFSCWVTRRTDTTVASQSPLNSSSCHASACQCSYGYWQPGHGNSWLPQSIPLETLSLDVTSMFACWLIVSANTRPAPLARDHLAVSAVIYIIPMVTDFIMPDWFYFMI